MWQRGRLSDHFSSVAAEVTKIGNCLPNARYKKITGHKGQVLYGTKLGRQNSAPCRPHFRLFWFGQKGPAVHLCPSDWCYPMTHTHTDTPGLFSPDKVRNKSVAESVKIDGPVVSIWHLALSVSIEFRPPLNVFRWSWPISRDRWHLLMCLTAKWTFTSS